MMLAFNDFSQKTLVPPAMEEVIYGPNSKGLLYPSMLARQ